MARPTYPPPLRLPPPPLSIAYLRDAVATDEGRERSCGKWENTAWGIT
jgi:hypothetical protein